MNKYLLEIGVEELPARYVNGAIIDFRHKAEKLLKENKISYGSLNIFVTPRRLSLIVEDIDLQVEDILLEVKGPAKKIAYDESGNPTKPLLGFMKSQNITEKDIIVKEFKGEEYVYGHIEKKSDSFIDVMKKNGANLIKSINFPKNMKWGGKSIKFVRPIRWVVSLLNDKVIDFDFEGIKVSNITRGHRFLGSSNIEIDNVDNYEKLLEDNYVILNQEKRRELIRVGSNKKAKSLGGEILEDEDLLNELTYIVEYPNPIVGNVKEEYLSLPKEVITTPMRDHLRFIPIYKNKDELLPYFITIRNGNDDYKDIVISGNEKVLGARLEDAKFFYKEDISKKLENYTDNLKGVMFQDKLGTMYNKTLRVKKLAEKIGQSLEVGEEALKSIRRSAELSKSDLTTKLVQEFTELQGVMGAIYAKNSGESEIISKAIYEQYLPRFSGDILPESTAGSVLAVADKIDTITGLFAIGLIPTGSQDPFALRRSAIGIINILETNKWDISLDDVVDSSLYIYAEDQTLAFDYDKVKNSILEFFRNRLKTIAEDRSIRYDVIDSVLSIGGSIIGQFKRFEDLNEYFNKDKTEILEALSRLHNLAKKKEKTVEIDTSLFETQEENNLYDSSLEILSKVEDFISKKEFLNALDVMEELKCPINNFFENTFILVEDEKVKNNRLQLLSYIDNVVKRIFDIEKIVIK